MRTDRRHTAAYATVESCFHAFALGLVGMISPDDQLQLAIPPSTKRALKLRSVETGDPVRLLVLKALRAAGYDVPDDAMVDRRKGNRP